MPSNYSLNFDYYHKEVLKVYEEKHYMAKNEMTCPTIVKLCKDNRIFTKNIQSFIISLHTEGSKSVSELYYTNHDYLALQKIFDSYHTFIDIMLQIIHYANVRSMGFLKVIVDIKYLIIGQHIDKISLEDILNIYFREEISKRIIKINN